MIEYRNISKRYAGHDVIESLSLTVPSGEFVVLIGPSGCGKSTLLKMLNRLVTPSDGDILLGGTRLNEMPLTKLRRQIGYVIQSTGLFPHWTVAKNIATVPRLLGWSPAKIEARTEQLMQQLDLLPSSYYWDKYPHELSGGQAQRVGVARALASDPDILLMDEPFGALDPITREALQREVRDIQRQTGKTVIFVTHDMDEALALADKIAIMQSGQLVQFDTPVEILINPANAFVEAFVGQSDLGLKLLSQRQVVQYTQPAKQRSDDAGHHWVVDAQNQPKALHGGKLRDDRREVITAVDAQWVAEPSMTMKEALSRMVWYRVAVLPVVGAGGELIGEVALSSIMEPPK
ncbi:ABC transporter ATP-binding protein [Ostreibacterium oceani]|uniref:ATP-binding cassette domain-containing protein n=1 Tax=Ostreibacterium oceani TaxID=2654998 RepID=A0A6N7F0P7_9GAMM|nr:ABC transporter ATP-binding protein [Ostreibacterium oceani]MPV85426.1 ATP-binding cassette domain-containing protein [Ostreibacterium oceani]